MTRRIAFALSLLFACAVPAVMHASSITYTITAIGSGYYGSQAFTSQTITFTAHSIPNAPAYTIYSPAGTFDDPDTISLSLRPVTASVFVTGPGSLAYTGDFVPGYSDMYVRTEQATAGMPG